MQYSYESIVCIYQNEYKDRANQCGGSSARQPTYQACKNQGY